MHTLNPGGRNLHTLERGFSEDNKMKLFPLTLKKQNVSPTLSHTMGHQTIYTSPQGTSFQERGRKKRKLTGTGHKLSEGLLCKGTPRNLLKGLGH